MDLQEKLNSEKATPSLYYWSHFNATSLEGWYCILKCVLHMLFSGKSLKNVFLKRPKDRMAISLFQKILK